MDLAPLAALVPAALLVACSAVPPASGQSTQAIRHQQAAPPAAPRADVAVAVLRNPAIPATDAEVAALRAEGPAALQRLLALHDSISAASTRATLAATIDRVAAQRYATSSRLYWHTDLDAAQAASRASGKPILSLRMLGRLDEDLSCANSRMFRTVLYPDAAVAKLLREKFVLHWSSERPVPRVTIDYGDGRTLATTVTGNSAHYVLDADGHVLDVLPGLYAPAVFRAELERAADVARRLDRAPAATLLAHHRGADTRLAARWKQIRAMTIIGDDPRAPTPQQVETALAAAQRATMSKAFVEVPMLRRLDLGADPGKLPDDLDVRAAAAARLFGIEPEHLEGARGRSTPRGGLLDAPTRALVTSLLPSGLDADQRAGVVRTLERTIAADTLLNDVRLRRAIRARLIAQLERGELPAFEPTNAWVYADVFLTPASDPWLGLLPSDTYTGLPGGAVTTGG